MILTVKTSEGHLEGVGFKQGHFVGDFKWGLKGARGFRRTRGWAQQKHRRGGEGLPLTLGE